MMNMPTIQQVKQYAAQIASNATLANPDEKALHTYRAKDGTPIYWRARLKNTTTGEKWIRPFWWNSESFTMGEPPAPPEGKPLYGLELLAQHPDAQVIVCEGENCADALNKVGAGKFIAITSGSASSAQAANWQLLTGREVTVWPDNDEAGKKYAEEVIGRLLGIAAGVKLLDTSAMNLPPKGDCVDWLRAGGTLDALMQLIQAAGSRTVDLNIVGDTDAPLAPPEPLPALPDVLQFDYSYLPDALRGYVQDIAERMQCPPDYAAVGAMVMVAAIVGRKVGMRPMRHNDWTVIPNLWGAIVGNSGVMKSPTLGETLTPIKKLQAAAYDVYNEAKASHDAQAELAKIQKSVKQSKAKASLKKDQNADVMKYLQVSEPDEEPILKRYLTNNSSYEALGEILIENPNGILVEADEIIGLLKQLDASGQEVARSFYLTAADGNAPYTFDRILRGKGLHIPALCISIIGGIQPGVLAEYVRQATSGGMGADGLLQRFGLMVYPDVSPNWKEVDRYPDSTARYSVNLLIERLDSLNPADIGAEADQYGGVPFLRFDDAAQSLFSEWRAKLEHRLRSGEEHPAIVSHLSKYRKLIPSLAVINHLCDSRHGAVSETALMRAIAFSEYLESHAQRIYSYATRPDIDAAKTLLKRMDKGKLSNPFTARDVYRNGWTGLESPAKAQAAIAILMDYRHLFEVVPETGGRPTSLYYRNDGLMA